MDYLCGQCGRPTNTAGHCPSCTFDRTGANVQPAPQDMLNLAVANRVRIEALEQRLDRLQRELAIQDRMLTELRRERAMSREMLTRPLDAALHKPQYDPTKPLPDVMPYTKGDSQ